MIQISDKRLLPCPFCGEDAVIGYFKANEQIRARDAYYVGCSNDHCGCEIEHSGGFRTLEEAIGWWNRRTK